MRIVIDLQGAQTQSRFRGIGRYSLSLAQAIARNAGEHEVWICLNANYSDTIPAIYLAFEGILPHNRIQSFQSPACISWENHENTWRRSAAEIIRESFVTKLQPDIVYISSLIEGYKEDACTSVGVYNADLKTATTIYDLIPLLNPDQYLGKGRTRQWYFNKIAHMKKANLLLAISKHARQEAIKFLNIESARVVNISSGISDFFKPAKLGNVAAQALYRRYNIRRPYIMYSGAFDVRKNIDRLLVAFSLLKDDVKAKYDLVMAGSISEFEKNQILRLSKKLNINDSLILTGYTSDDDLVALYSQCELFAFPSLHEGFGLPALEAMACGAPTIGSNITSIPEVIALDEALFDPYDPKSISNKITSILSDENLRMRLREHGLKQAKKFSWDQSAKRAIDAFESIYVNDLIPNKLMTGAQFSEQKSEYQKLIQAIAKISINTSAPEEKDLINCSTSIEANLQIKDYFLPTLPEHITWRIEGPFDSNYSLAIINREIARSLDSLDHYAVLHSTEGPGDFPADPKYLRMHPILSKLHERSKSISQERAHVTSRNLYPPRVADMRCRINLLHNYAWEETAFPPEWIEQFNKHLHGIACVSQHVQKILIDNGVNVPLCVTGNGVDHWERILPDKNFKVPGRSFRFLHVSSCFPRKGANILLDAFGRLFSNDDDVTLIIKTFPNPHNEIHESLSEAKKRNANFPDVLIIDKDLSEKELKALYQECHVLVAPSFAEGFGLPLAEAMLSGLAVITTGWGGQLEFCNDQTAWLVDYTFERAKSHFKLFDSVWAIPVLDHLTEIMNEVFKLPETQRKQRSLLGRKLLLERWSWSMVTSRLIASVRSWANILRPSTPRIGWITTWNSPCGIASYSSHLINNISTEVTVFAPHDSLLIQQDSSGVVRCWDIGANGKLSDLKKEIRRRKIDTVVVQFNYGFFNFDEFADLIDQQINEGRIVIVAMHSTKDPIHIKNKHLKRLSAPLSRCHRILVHSPEDMNNLKKLDLVKNVTLFPHGIIKYSGNIKISSHCATIGSYGFFLPNKGLLELIDAFFLLFKEGMNIRLRMVNSEYPIPESAALIKDAKKKISGYGLNDRIEMQTEFLPDSESLSLLEDCDLIVFPYQGTSESSSAAVRYGIATERPVAVTPISIFDDVAHAVFKLPGFNPEKIAHGIKDILTSFKNRSADVEEKSKEARRWRNEHYYSLIGTRLSNMIQALWIANINCESESKIGQADRKKDKNMNRTNDNSPASERIRKNHKGCRVVHNLKELDHILKELDEAAAISDDELRRVFKTFRMEFPFSLPIDPYSEEYKRRQFEFYEYLAGKPYNNLNEISEFDVDSAAIRPFPFYTGSSQTVGNHLIAIGHLIRTLDIPAGSSVLEFGPGWGNTTVWLARMGYNVTAIDIERRFVDLISKRGKQKGLDIELINGDFSLIHSMQRTWNAVLFFECFHHCADHHSLIEGLNKVVAPGGKVLFASEPITKDFYVPWGFRLDGESLWAIRRNGWCELGFQERYFRDLMRKNGWELSKHVCSETPWGEIFVAVRINE